MTSNFPAPIYPLAPFSQYQESMRLLALTAENLVDDLASLNNDSDYWLRAVVRHAAHVRQLRRMVLRAPDGPPEDAEG